MRSSALVTGVLAAEARALNLGFMLRITENRPLVTLKLARTADGYAGADGKPLVISSAFSKQRIHLARAAHDAIMVGIGTVISDDPDLTCRLPGMMHRSPVRVIIDTHLETPVTARIIETAAKVPTWLIAIEDAAPEREAALSLPGVSVIRVAKGQSGHVDPRAALAALASRGITRVFSEGGPTFAEALAEADLIDRVEIITSPEALGRAGTIALRPGLLATLNDPKRFRADAPMASGRDRLQCFERIA